MARGGGDRADHGSSLPPQQRVADSAYPGMEAALAAQAGSQGERLHSPGMGGPYEEASQETVIFGKFCPGLPQDLSLTRWQGPR